MKECWREGDLRAYIDRELPGEDLERVAAHLEQCGACRAAHERLAARASSVADWMGALDPAIPARPVRASPPTWKWGVAVSAIAAGLLIGFLAMPRRTPPPPVVEITPPPVVQQAAEAPPVAEQIPRPRPVRRVRPVPARQETVERFIPLDADPIETGVIMRVTYGPENLQADIIFGPDGRARAYRLIDAVQSAR